MPKLNLLLLSTPVGALGSGLGGGVELTLQNLARSLSQRSHTVKIVAPAGSVCGDFPVVQIPGTLQALAQTVGRDAPVVLPPDSVLANMWSRARQVQAEFDLLLNFAYDWLPFYLTPFFQTPIAHLVSMGSVSEAMDAAIGQVAGQFPGTIGVHSRAQAETFSFVDRCRSLGNGFDLSQYQFNSLPQRQLGWVGRVSPEKGLEDAVVAAERAGLPLKVWGVIQDRDYWEQIRQTYPQAQVSYEGFLPTAELQRAIGNCQGLIMTPKWVEAFGNVAIEALACGVPVIAYRRGGPGEIVQSGRTGWLVEPDSVPGLVQAIAQLDQLDRAACRRQAESEYSLEAMGDRLEQWFQEILGNSHH